MQDIQLDDKKKAQLDGNIKKMLEGGANEDDIMQYASDFKNQFGQKKNPVGSQSSATQLLSQGANVLGGGILGDISKSVPKTEQKEKPRSKYDQPKVNPNRFLDIGEPVVDPNFGKNKAGLMVGQVPDSKPAFAPELAIRKGELQGRLANVLSTGKRPTNDELGQIAMIQSELQSIPQSEADAAFQKEGWNVFKTNPLLGAEFLGETVLSSLTSLFEAGKRTVPAAIGIGAAAGAPIAGIGAIGGAISGLTAGVTTGGFNLSTSGKIIQTLSDEGVDVADKDSLIAAFSDEVKMSKIRKRALKYGIPIAVLDAISGGFAGKLVAGAAGKSLAKRTLAGFGEVGMQSFAGMTGEAGGQYLADGKLNRDEILLEGIAGLVTDVPEIVSGVAMEKLKNRSSSKKTLATQVAVLGNEMGADDAKYNLNRDLANKVITPEEHEQGVAFVEKAVEINNKIPEIVIGENRATSIELIEERERLTEEVNQREEQKKGIDVAYHKVLDESNKEVQKRIDEINNQLGELAKPEKNKVPKEEVIVEDWSKDVESIEKNLKDKMVISPDGRSNNLWGIEELVPYEEKQEIMRLFIDGDYSKSVPISRIIAEAYNKAKSDNSNPKLVKAVEDLLGKPKNKVVEEEIQQPIELSPELPEGYEIPNQAVEGDVIENANKLNREAGIDLFVARKPIEIKGEKFVLSQIKENNNDNSFIVENDKGEEIGKAQLSADGNFLENIRIDEKYRRKGLATQIYDFIELQKGIELEPSPNKQSKEAKELWDKRNLQKSISKKANGGLLGKALNDALKQTINDQRNKAIKEKNIEREKTLKEDEYFMKGREKSQIEKSKNTINEKYDEEIKKINEKFDKLISSSKQAPTKQGEIVEEVIVEEEIQQPIEYKRLVEPIKPISEMNSEELYELATQNRKALKEQDKEFFNKSEEEKEKGGYYNAIDDVEDLRDASERINFIENAENVDDLANSVKSILSKRKEGQPNEYELAILNAARRKSVELGVEPKDLIKSIASKVANEYEDSSDAELMVANVLEKLMPKQEQNIQPQLPNQPIEEQGEIVEAVRVEQEPETKEGVKVVTLSGMDENERVELVEKRKADTKLTDEEVRHNEFVDLQKSIAAEKSRSGKNEIVNKIRQKVREINAELGSDVYKFDGVSVRKKNKKGVYKKVTRTNKDNSGRAIKEDAVLITDRDSGFAAEFERLADSPNLEALEVDRGDKTRMTKEQIIAAYEDAINGVPSVQADNLLNVLEEAYNKGYFEVVDRTTEPYTRVQVPFNEFLGVEQEEVGQPLDEDAMIEWLNEIQELPQEEQIEIDNIILEYEQQPQQIDISGKVQSPNPTSEKRSSPEIQPTKEGKGNGSPKAEVGKQPIGEAKPKQEDVEPKQKEEKKQEPKKKVSEQNQKLADKIRAMKIDLSKLSDGGLQSNPLGLPVALWNTSMDIIAKAVEAGELVSDAVKRGLNYIKDNYKNRLDENKLYEEVIKMLGFNKENIDFIEANGNKVVDINGNPKLLYRSQDDDRVQGAERQSKHFGIYFSENKESTKIYGKNTKSYYVNLKNPQILEGSKWNLSVIPEYLFNYLKSKGYDGAIWIRQGEMYEVVAFDKSQIKEVSEKEHFLLLENDKISGKGKEIADLLRKGKIKIGGLQSNIAGIPIALYNTVIETIALGLEGGASLSQAVSNAIKKHNLNKQKDFNKNEFVKVLEDSIGEKITVEEEVEVEQEEKKKTPLEEKYEQINKLRGEKVKELAKQKLISDNFDSIVSQLMTKNKIKRKC